MKTTTVNPPYPGYLIQMGSTGSNVALIQTYLNALKEYFPSLNTLKVDGQFGTKTKNNVIIWQAGHNLTTDGIVGNATWDSIVSEYNKYFPLGPDTYPGVPLRVGSKGPSVETMQTSLNNISKLYTVVASQTVDGNFGSNTELNTKRFQEQFGLSVDGVIGQFTWDKIILVDKSMATDPVEVTTQYPGYLIQMGSTGEKVRIVQCYLNSITKYLGMPWSTVSTDGNFGTATKTAVIAFQVYYKLSADGIVGNTTWTEMVAKFNESL